MRTFTILAMVLFSAAGTAAAATADDPSPAERVWRLFPSEVEPYRPGTVPLHLTDRDFAANRADDGGGYAPRGGTLGGHSDRYGNGVYIDVPGGSPSVFSLIQGMIQDFGRAVAIDGDGSTARASTCVCGGDGNYDSRSGGTGTSYK